MKTKIFLFISTIICATFSVYQLKSQTWTTLSSGITTHLQGVSAPNYSTCYVAGYSGKILKTINGGVTWLQQTSGTSQHLYSICFTDENIGYAVGDNGAAVKTVNGGSTWSSMPVGTGTSIGFRCVYFFDSITGFIVGGTNGGGFPGTILKTINAGLTWTNLTTAPASTNSLYSIFFTSALNGFSAGYDGKVIKTTDGGISWSAFSSGSSNMLVGGMHFTNTSTGFVSGKNGVMLKTINSGISWSALTSGTTTDDLTGIDFYDANNGCAVGGNVSANTAKIVVTANGGITWAPVTLNPGISRLCRVDFVDQFTGYAVGLDGTILKTEISGLSITSPANSTNINNRCDLNFCIQDSLGEIDTNNPVYVTNSNVYGGGNFHTTPYNIGTTGILNNFCLTNTAYSFTPGIHKFYLWYSTFGIVDSVELNIVNPINDLCSSLSFSRTPITNVDYMFSVNGLDPSETYTLRLRSFNGPATDSIVVSGGTTGNLTQHYAHNGIFYPILSVTSACENYCDDSTGNSVNITNGCASYSSLTQAGFQNTAICLDDSASFSGLLNYTNLSGNDTSSIMISWGDGITETNLFPTDTNGVNTIIRHHLYTSPGVYTALIKFYNDSACYNDSVITTIIVNVCGNLKGNVYNDLNNNCTRNTGELDMDHICIKVKQGSNSYLAWTDSMGNYEFTTLPVGSYIIQINNLNLGYIITCGNSLAHAINVTTGITIVNFATYCNGLDIAVTGMSLLNSFVPGQTSAILPYVGIFNNTCYTALPGQVKIILSPCLTYTTICPWGNTHPSPTHVLQANTGDTLVWDVSDINDLGTFGYFDYFAHVTTCTTAQVGDTACVSVIVLPTIGDADTSNNTFTACFEIGVSFDPNNKEVIPKGNGIGGDIPINTPNLTYTINFQNTGTATAYNIYLLDSISANLDISSIEIISSSHQVQPYSLPNRTLKFMFANIMLADSTHDEEHSHGYVTYRIKLNSGLTAGMQIKNTAYIYFDYNSPVVTNTTINTIETLAGIQNMNTDRLFKVYPNPANDKLIVRVDKNGSNYIVITDVLGNKVKQLKTTELQTEINVSDLQSGIYFIQLSKENMNSVQKIIIRK